LVEIACDVNEHISSSLTRRVPSSNRESFAYAAAAGAISESLAKELEPSAGMRNVLRHEYFEIDLGRVAASVSMAKDGYGRYIREVARFLKTNPDR
ncbi:MAG: DUF86 domain-containing protein, partial [Streptosporangiales bacterium]|nr:DUF86 domain-containing protein [Streptosporangiales bacterium]